MHEEDSAIRMLSREYCVLELAPGKVCELDMGCGSGSFTAALAARYPERRILAADVMLGRLRKVVKRLRKSGSGNWEVLRVEARMLIGRMLPDASLDRLHLLCPDPWPKGRHRGHRLLASDFTAALHRVLKSDGIFHFSSDDENYCRAVEEVMTQSRLFAPDPDGAADLADVKSDFELKWLAEGKLVRHLTWRKLPLPPHTVGH
jgi:tRNA (guanine-N7-)-methyltransferase